MYAAKQSLYDQCSKLKFAMIYVIKPSFQCSKQQLQSPQIALITKSSIQCFKRQQLFLSTSQNQSNTDKCCQINFHLSKHCFVCFHIKLLTEPTHARAYTQKHKTQHIESYCKTDQLLRNEHHSFFLMLHLYNLALLSKTNNNNFIFEQQCKWGGIRRKKLLKNGSAPNNK